MQTNANKRVQMQTNAAFRLPENGPERNADKRAQTRANAGKREQTRNQGITPPFTHPFCGSPVYKKLQSGGCPSLLRGCQFTFWRGLLYILEAEIILGVLYRKRGIPQNRGVLWVPATDGNSAALKTHTPQIWGVKISPLKFRK